MLVLLSTYAAYGIRPKSGRSTSRILCPPEAFNRFTIYSIVDTTSSAVTLRSKKMSFAPMRMMYSVLEMSVGFALARYVLNWSNVDGTEMSLFAPVNP